MLAYSVRRLLAAFPVLLAASFVVFWVSSLLGDPVRNQYGGRTPPAPPALIAHEYARLHLRDGFFAQYWRWLTGMLAGDFGPSVQDDRIDIAADITGRLAVTLRLVVGAMLIALVLALVTGVLSAVRRYSRLDHALTFVGFVFLAMPAFWIAVLLKQAAIAVNDLTATRPIATIGERSVPAPDGAWNTVADTFGHLLLPTLSLAAITYAAWSRFQRAAMLDVLNSDYIRLARAKGLKPRQVLVKHALRTALIPMTTASALTIATIFGGAVITETVFQWQGMGKFLVQSVLTHDRNATMAWLVVAGTFVIVGNLIADLLYAVLDPRIRYG